MTWEISARWGQKERLWKHTQSSGNVQVKVAEKEGIPPLRRGMSSYFLLSYIFILFPSGLLALWTMLPTLRVHLTRHMHTHKPTSVSVTHANPLLKHPTGAAEGHVSISKSSQGANRDETWQKDVLTVNFYDIAINMKHLSGEGIVTTTLCGFDSFNGVLLK